MNTSRLTASHRQTATHIIIMAHPMKDWYDSDLIRSGGSSLRTCIVSLLRCMTRHLGRVELRKFR